jgi:hypothetical protein
VEEEVEYGMVLMVRVVQEVQVEEELEVEEVHWVIVE